MRVNKSFFVAAFPACALLASSCVGDDERAWLDRSAATVYEVKGDALDLGSVAFKGGGTLKLSIGIGSGAYFDKSEGVLYTVSDRGPNIHCEDVEEVIGLDANRACQGDETGKLFHIPEFAPSIYRIKLNRDRTFSIDGTLVIADRAGQPVGGISNPLKRTDTGYAYGVDGARLPMSPDGLNTEAIVKLSDDTFWLSEEYGPSIVHVGADGRVIERIVPVGLEKDLADGRYDVVGKLPSIWKRRKRNRGIESLAVSGDEKYLYFSLQSPLANPDYTTFKSSRIVRLGQYDLKQGRMVGEYVHVIDPPASFVADNEKRKRKQSNVKISELKWLAPNKLLVLEHISKSTKLYQIDLTRATNILGGVWDMESKNPSLESLSVTELGGEYGIDHVAKKLVLRSENYPQMPSKVEGVGIVDAKTLIFVNDNDFGVGGDEKTIIVSIPLEKPLY